MKPEHWIKSLAVCGVALVAAGELAPTYAGNVINQASGGGAPIVVSNVAPTQLLQANGARFGWTVYCAGTAGTIAALMMPGTSAGAAAAPAPSQTVGFPLPANTLVNDQDFLVSADAMHQRIDAEAQGSSPVNCYTWEEQ
ncbi:MAG TPA: hypothetical protein VKS22_07170 [Candidatus Binataceae bacterium]|nr:hypothetical protein [Candidatus Binataceae bacterium]